MTETGCPEKSRFFRVDEEVVVAVGENQKRELETMKSIAFFDVDGTLIKGYSGYYTTLELIRRKIIKKRKLPLAIFYKVISSIFYMGDIKKMYQMAIEDI